MEEGHRLISSAQDCGFAGGCLGKLVLQQVWADEGIVATDAEVFAAGLVANVLVGDEECLQVVNHTLLQKSALFIWQARGDRFSRKDGEGKNLSCDGLRKGRTIFITGDLARLSCQSLTNLSSERED